MKIVLFSNYFNHHQAPFALAANSLPQVDYVFVANTPFNSERIKVGYRDQNYDYDFILRAYESKDHEKQALMLAKEADVVIVGAAPLFYVDERLRSGRFVFRQSERLFKEGTGIKMLPKNLGRVVKNRLWSYQHSPVYYLAMSAYLASDLNLFSNFRNKVFRWAYFTENRDIIYSDLEKQRMQNKKMIILWVGRFLKWKHPDTSIRLAKELKERGYSFQLNIIGEGEMHDKLDNMIHAFHLEDCVYLLGSMSSGDVRKHMEHADIFLFTSDSNEGWGAVLNEAMSSGCAVVASHACGSSPFLIQNGLNGFLYENGNETQLLHIAKKLFNDISIRKEISYNAFQNMRELWSPMNAAKRFLELSLSIKEKHKPFFYENGPCSMAPVYKTHGLLKS